MREGQRSGVVLPRIIVERVISQFDTYAAQGIDESPYYGPVRRMPPEITEPERTRLAKAYAAAVEERLQAGVSPHGRVPARRVPAFRARDGRHLRDPGGAAYYAYLIRAHTTTTVNADEVHRLGLAEVARIRSGMTAAMRKASFDGSLARFFAHVRSDGRFEPRSAEELADGYAAIGRRVDAAVPGLFAALPKTPLAIRPTPAAQAVHDAAARYNDGLARDRPAGRLLLQHARPAGAQALAHGDALPSRGRCRGTICRARRRPRNTALPKLLRFDGNTAYNEGWAL
jgi:uncharacterized protein (DUF885 family)